MKIILKSTIDLYSSMMLLSLSTQQHCVCCRRGDAATCNLHLWLDDDSCRCRSSTYCITTTRHDARLVAAVLGIPRPPVSTTAGGARMFCEEVLYH